MTNDELLAILLKLGFVQSPYGVNGFSKEINGNEKYHLMAKFEPKGKGNFHFYYRETWGCNLDLSKMNERVVEEIIALVENIAACYEDLDKYTNKIKFEIKDK